MQSGLKMDDASLSVFKPLFPSLVISQMSSQYGKTARTYVVSSRDIEHVKKSIGKIDHGIKEKRMIRVIAIENSAIFDIFSRGLCR